MSNGFWMEIKERAVGLRPTARNAAWIISGKAVIFLLGFAFITGLANLVPKQTVGDYNYIIAVLTIASITTLPGMNAALVRAVARGYEGSLRPMMRKKILCGITGSVIAFGFGTAYLAHGNVSLGLAFLIAAPLVPMTDTYSEMAYSFFQGRKNFKKTMFLAVVCQMCFSIPSLLILFFTHNLIIIALSFFVFQTIGGLLVYAFAQPANDRRDHESELLGFHLTIQNIPRIVAFNIDTIIVFAVAGPAAAAIYTFAFTPMAKLEQLIPVDTLALPDLSNRERSVETKRLIWNRVGLLAMAMVPAIAIGWWLSPFAYRVLFPAFPESVGLFRLLLTVLLTTPFAMMRSAFVAWNKKRELYINEFASPVIRIGLMVILGFPYGSAGVIVAIIVARLIEAILTGVLFYRMR